MRPPTPPDRPIGLPPPGDAPPPDVPGEPSSALLSPDDAGLPPPLGDTPSTFSLGELAGVCASYELGEIRAVYAFPRGSRRSPKALLETSRGRFVLKRRARGRDDPYRVALAHRTILRLASSGFPAPRLVGTRRDNNSMVQMNGRVYEVFEFVEGDRFDRTPSGSREGGACLASLHAILAPLAPETGLRGETYHDSPGVRARLDTLRTRGRGEHDAAGTLRTLYDRAAASVRLSARRQLVHADWHPGNIIFRGSHVACVLDFDALRPAHPAIDLANGMLQFSMTRVALDPDRWPDPPDLPRFDAFLAGYLGAGGPPAELGVLESLVPLMIEALIAEVAVPIADTGGFAGRPGLPFLLMGVRKASWLDRERDRLTQRMKGIARSVESKLPARGR